MSDPASILYREIYKRLLPDTPYRFNSGGDPIQIPDLTHQQLVSFHRRHYHPSNAQFFSYGDLDPPLAYLHEQILSEFDARPWIRDTTQVPVQASWAEPRPMHEFPCPPDPMPIDPSKQSTFTKSFLLPDVSRTDAVTIVALSLMSSLLVSGADSPFHRSLIVPSIGSGYSPMTGLSGGRQALWSIGLQGVHRSDHERIHDAIDATLAQVSETGLDRDRIDAVLHQYRLEQQEMKTDMGLQILYRILNRWLHDGDVPSMMPIEAHLDEIARRLDTGPYLQDLIRHHLIDNPHTLCTLMNADPSYLDDRARAEQAILDRTPIDAAALVADADQLWRSQHRHDDADCLPSLTRHDIGSDSPVDTARIEIRRHENDGGDVHRIVVDTNGMAYVKLLMDTAEIDDDLRPLLGVFTRLVTGMGAADRSYEEMSRRRLMFTGGISASLELHSRPDDLRQLIQTVTIQSSSLSSNTDPMIELLLDAARRPMFRDPDRLRQLLKSQAVAVADSVVESGHVFARLHSSSHHSLCLQARNAYHGLDHAVRMATLATHLDDDSMLQMATSLSRIAESLRLVRVSITESDDARIDSVQDRIGAGWVPISDSRSRDSAPPATAFPARKTFVAVPLDAVNNVALSVATDVPYAHEDRAGLQALARIVSTEYLHRELREKGGAYGGGAVHSPDGAFSFYSYRDPHVLPTIETFANAIAWCQNPDNITDERLNQALLSLFGSMDAPKHPAAHGQLHFCAEIAPDMRRQYRKRLLGLTPDHVCSVARRYFADFHPSKATITVVGNESDMEQAQNDSSWTVQRLAETANGANGAATCRPHSAV